MTEPREATKSSNAERIHQIIEAIGQEGPLTVKELLPGMPGLTTQARVRNIVSIGKGWGVLQNLTGDGDLPERRMEGKGAATRFVEVSRYAGCVVGLNVGRTYFAIGVADPNGRLFSTYGPPPKDKEDEEAWELYREGQMIVHERKSGLTGVPLLKHIAKMTIEWLETLGIDDDELRGVTLSLPTPVSTTDSKVLTKSIEPTLGDMDIEQQFKARLGKNRFPKLQKVVIANDADVAARGEVRYGKAFGQRDVVALHVAYGVGAGIITDGKVLRTGSGGGAGEIGHCLPMIFQDEGKDFGLPALDHEDELYTCKCRCTGHLEAMTGGEAIVRRIKAREKIEPEPPEELAAVLGNSKKSVAEKLDAILVAAAGEEPWEPARAAMSDVAHLIGGAVHTLTHLFKPEAVYLSGKLAEAGEDFLDEVRSAHSQLGSLGGYEAPISLGTASSRFDRQLIMVRGAAMTAVRSTESLITKSDLKEIEEGNG